MSWTLATFNVNGIRARLPVLARWLEQNTPDLVCLQEIKCQDQDFPTAQLAELGYYCRVRGQKSFHGVAVLSRVEPEEERLSFNDGGAEAEARLLAVRLGDIWVVNTYCPQGRQVGSEAFQYKLEFFGRLRRFLAEELGGPRRLVWTGDINVAPGDLDVFDPDKYRNDVGCHPDERAALSRVLDLGLNDCFRALHPEERAFTFWDYRLPAGFKRDLGWRIDHIYASPEMAETCGRVWVDKEPRGWEKPSDHTPVLASFNLP